MHVSFMANMTSGDVWHLFLHRVLDFEVVGASKGLLVAYVEPNKKSGLDITNRCLKKRNSRSTRDKREIDILDNSTNAVQAS